MAPWISVRGTALDVVAEGKGFFSLRSSSKVDGAATARVGLRTSSHCSRRHFLLPARVARRRSDTARGTIFRAAYTGTARVRVDRARASGASRCRGHVAVVGLFDLAFVSLQAWRESGVPGWYREQLGLDYEGLSGLPENWVFNTGDEENPMRRLVSTFLSPLASAYALVVALSSRIFAGTGACSHCSCTPFYTHPRRARRAFGLVVLARWVVRGALLASVVVARSRRVIGPTPATRPKSSVAPPR
jgi:hypothetical protein